MHCSTPWPEQVEKKAHILSDARHKKLSTILDLCFSWLDQAHPAALGFQRGIPLLSAAVTAARICEERGGPLLSVQLDHGAEEDLVMAALEAGVDSVMWVLPWSTFHGWFYVRVGIERD